MKKFIQIALVIMLVCVLFQTMAAGSMASASSGVVSGTLLTDETDAANVHALLLCPGVIKGVYCTLPSVGWNT